MSKQPGQVDFAEALLQGLALPETPANVQGLTAWEAAEGGNWDNNAAYNPLDTTLAETGSSAINSAGVQAYTSWTEGIGATEQTLGSGDYAPILSALGAGTSAQAVATAVAASPWGTEAFSPSLGISETQAAITANVPKAAAALGSSKSADQATTASWYDPATWGADISGDLSKAGSYIAIGAVVVAGLGLALLGALKATGAGRKAVTIITQAAPAASAAAAL